MISNPKNILTQILILFYLIFQFSGCDNIKKEKPKDKIATKVDSTIKGIYLLNTKFVNQYNKPFKLIENSGYVVLMSMVFTSCEFACPRIIEDLKSIEKMFIEKGIRYKIVLVSFDSKRDKPDKLLKFFMEKEMNPNWILLTSDENSIREVSMLLNVSYEKMDDGSFSHSNIISLIDNYGNISYQLEGLGSDKNELMNKAIVLK